MSEPQLRSLSAFQKLPIYDESDAQANSLTNGNGRPVRECTTMQEVEDCLKNIHLIPLGGLRVKSGGREVVVAYFGESA
jgi:hypothetical protein